MDTENIDAHVEHLEKVFARLRQHKLYVKKEKCEFCCSDVMFFGHWIGQGQIRMDKHKVQVIMEWVPPMKVSELHSFLGLANYYRRFIEG